MASKPEIAARSSAAVIVAALLLPPLGVYLVQGLGPAFWITAVLTCLGLAPGIVFALAAIIRRGMAAPGAVA